MSALRWMVAILALVAAGCPGRTAGSPVGPGGGGSGVGTNDGDGGDEGGEDGDADSDGDGDDGDGAPPPDEDGILTETKSDKSDKSKSGKSRKKRSKRKPKPKRESVVVAERERTAAVERTERERAELIRPRLARARAALRGGKPEVATVEARAALEIDSANLEALSIVAEAYYEMGWHAKAARILAAATEGPGAGDARLWMLRGLVADATGAPLAEIQTAYERATKIDPRYAKARNNLGVTYLRLRRYPRAIAELETARSIDPQSPRILTNLGTAYRRHATENSRHRVELLRKAERAYRAAIGVDEEYAPAYLNLGILYLDSPELTDMKEIERLKAAITYLRDFKQRKVPAVAEDGSPISVDVYLDDAQRRLERLERQR